MKTLLATLLLAGLAAAEGVVGATKFADYDMKAIKAGQWHEYSEVTSIQKRKDLWTTTHILGRTACVKADDDTVWIEDTRWEEARPEIKLVTLMQVRRSDGITVKGWVGKPGGEGTEAKVKEPDAPDPSQPAPEKVGTVTQDKITVNGKDVDAQKAVVTSTWTKDGKTTTVVKSNWLSAEAPLTYLTQGETKCVNLGARIKWDKEPKGPAGWFRIVVKAETWTTTIQINKTGTDAKPTLTVK
ncbi:MAG: hypothetical protein K8T20_04305 [Planctomycetes bacterium]|nr:hypothetical protein [Planctomycetota bacterium]